MLVMDALHRKRKELEAQQPPLKRQAPQKTPIGDQQQEAVRTAVADLYQHYKRLNAQQADVASFQAVLQAATGE
jgi:hypothetical protein